MKRITALILTLIMVVLSLSACGGDTGDAPEGMQLVRGGDAYGYYLYAPEGWRVANQGNIAATYVSSIDTSSVTLTEAEIPNGDIAGYFEAAKSEFTFDINVTVNGENCKLGNAEEAKQYVYDYKYWNWNADNEKVFFDVRTMQIFARFDGHFYMLTFTAQMSERVGGQSYYDYHLENSLKSILDNVKFVKRSGEPETPEYPEVDGYILASRRELCGFDLYVTKEYSVDFSDAIVSVTRPDGANINVSKCTSTGLYMDDYWSNRKKELEAIVGEVEEIQVNFTDGVKLGNLTTAASYEYTYTQGGIKYHVYQVFGVNYVLGPLAADGYAFTFTAPEEIYGERIEEALDILSRVEF